MIHLFSECQISNCEVCKEKNECAKCKNGYCLHYGYCKGMLHQHR